MIANPTSERRAPETRRATPLSQRLWGLEWSRILPWQFDSVEVVPGSFAEAMPFVEAHYAGIFKADGQGERFLSDPMTPAKLRFGEEMDVFLMRSEGREVGVMMAHPTDWSSYYVRTIAVLPEARNQHVVTQFAAALDAPLRAVGAERIEADVSPGNLPMLRVLIGQGWVVNGTQNSERWGSHLRLCRFLRPEAEQTFAKQFCGLHVKKRPG